MEDAPNLCTLCFCSFVSLLLTVFPSFSLPAEFCLPKRKMQLKLAVKKTTLLFFLSCDWCHETTNHLTAHKDCHRKQIAADYTDTLSLFHAHTLYTLNTCNLKNINFHVNGNVQCEVCIYTKSTRCSNQ